MTFSIDDIQHNDTQHAIIECHSSLRYHYAECHYAKCMLNFAVKPLRVIVIFKPNLLSAVMLSVVMPNVKASLLSPGLNNKTFNGRNLCLRFTPVCW